VILQLLQRYVCLGNEAIVRSQKKRSIVVETKEETQYVHDFLFIPELKQILFSVGKMLANGYL
jgi:hypothetical protein